jgi:phage/plasmid-like protein (TIGR03299 family)
MALFLNIIRELVQMPANVESMFYVRQAPWHGLGEKVEQALNSKEALQKSGLDWQVIQKTILTEDQMEIPGFKANIRESDNRVLGVVTNRYKIVQNHEAFSFTDQLLGEGVRYETAGSLQNGKKVWLLARLPENYKILGDDVNPYFVFSNSHDGTGSIKVAMTPIRVVCQNTLNLALGSAKRIWSTIHTGNIDSKLDEAKKTLLLADLYMKRLGAEAERLNQIKIPDHKIMEYIDMLLPMPDQVTKIQERNVKNLRGDLKCRYFDAPDLSHVSKNGYRFINAVSDFHSC